MKAAFVAYGFPPQKSQLAIEDVETGDKATARTKGTGADKPQEERVPFDTGCSRHNVPLTRDNEHEGKPLWVHGVDGPTPGQGLTPNTMACGDATLHSAGRTVEEGGYTQVWLPGRGKVYLARLPEWQTKVIEKFLLAGHRVT